jgi:hypothetical protein
MGTILDEVIDETVSLNEWRTITMTTILFYSLGSLNVFTCRCI